MTPGGRLSQFLLRTPTALYFVIDFDVDIWFGLVWFDLEQDESMHYHQPEGRRSCFSHPYVVPLSTGHLSSLLIGAVSLVEPLYLFSFSL